MSHKVEMTEVLAFSDHVGTTVSNVRGQLSLIQESLGLIGEMDSFKGKTAEAAKSYLNDFHDPIIATFDNLFESLERNLKKQVDNFQSYVDSSDSALIESNYLNDNLQVIGENQRAIIESFDRVKSILSDVSDISSVRIPATLEVNQSFTEVIASIQKLEQRLSSFTNEWEGDHSQIKDLLKYLETTLSQAEQMTGEARYSELSSSWIGYTKLDSKIKV